MFNDKYFKLAIEEAKIAFAEDEVPVGCVAVTKSGIIVRNHNRMVQMNDPTAHAEVLVLRELCAILKTSRLDDYDISLFSTLEPCRMCSGAVFFARVKRIYFCIPDEKFGCIVSNDWQDKRYGTEYYYGFCAEEVRQIMSDFFVIKRY